MVQSDNDFYHRYRKQLESYQKLMPEIPKRLEIFKNQLQAADFSASTSFYNTDSKESWNSLSAVAKNQYGLSEMEKAKSLTDFSKKMTSSINRRQHALDSLGIASARKLNDHLTSFDYKKELCKATHQQNAFISKAQKQATGDIRSSTQLNELFNKLGLKEQIRNEKQLKNTFTLLGPKQMEQILEEAKQSAAELEPSQFAQELNQSQTKDINVDDIDKTRHAHTHEFKKFMQGTFDNIVQQYYDLPPISQAILNAVLTYQISKIFSNLVSKVGIFFAITFIMFLIAPNKNQK